MESNNVCKFCYAKAEMVCNRCRDRYCSRACQELDWPEHKLVCFPLPSLVKAVNIRNTHAYPKLNVSIKSESQSSSPKMLSPVSHLATNLQSFEMTPGCDKSSKHSNSNGSLRINNENVEQPANVHSADRNQTTEKPTDKKVFKPVDCKWDKVDVTSMRKPGVLSQVIPNQVTSEQCHTSQQPKQVTSQPQPKNATKEAEKQEPVQKTVVPPKKVEVVPPKKVEVVPIPTKDEPKTGPWMKPFPIDENVFVEVLVQHTTPEITWVTMLKHDTANNTLLRNINKNISFTSQPDPKEVRVNSLFFVPFEGIYYRGVVLNDIAAKGTVSVRLVDYGNQFELAISDLRSPLPAVMELNAYAFPVIFKKAKAVEVGNQIKIKKEMMKGDVALVVVEGENTIVTMKDIETVPIPVGSSTKLYCLDFSNIGLGYICASIAGTPTLKMVDDMIPKITEHCQQSKDVYRPQVDELCLAEFEDGLWYRALTLKVIESDSFEILFIDYGNIITTNSSNIRKITDKFMYRCLMNYCYVKDLDLKSKECVLKMARHFDENQVFEARSVEKNDGRYVIEVTI